MATLAHPAAESRPGWLYVLLLFLIYFVYFKGFLSGQLSQDLLFAGLVNQLIMYFRVLQVIKSLQDSPEVGNNLPGIDDNVRERGLEQKYF